jgi:hypothetical protein
MDVMMVIILFAVAMAAAFAEPRRPHAAAANGRRLPAGLQCVADVGHVHAVDDHAVPRVPVGHWRVPDWIRLFADE